MTNSESISRYLSSGKSSPLTRISKSSSSIPLRTRGTLFFSNGSICIEHKIFTSSSANINSRPIKGILKGLNYKDQVTSPTFTLVNEYNANYKVIHIDFYRESNVSRWLNLGLNEYMDSKNIVLIEWGNLIKEILPDDIIVIKFENLEQGKRKIYSEYEYFSH